MVNEEQNKDVIEKTADKLVQQLHESVEKEKEGSDEFKILLKAFEDAPLQKEDVEALASILSLPEDSFRILGPIFLGEMEKVYGSIENKTLMAQTMNATDTKVDDVLDLLFNIQNEIDKVPEETLSQIKKDFLKQILNMTYNSIAELDGVDKRRLFVPIEFCNENAKYPAYAHESDAGMDVYALEDITIHPGETKLIPIGVKVAIPAGYELQVRPKSGRCLKTKLRVANAPGTIDSGYRDEIGVIVDNIDPFIKEAKISEDGKITEVLYGSDYTIGKGEKFAQLVLSEVPKVMWVKSEDVSVLGEDRNGGFGSTGLK